MGDDKKGVLFATIGVVTILLVGFFLTQLVINWIFSTLNGPPLLVSPIQWIVRCLLGFLGVIVGAVASMLLRGKLRVPWILGVAYPLVALVCGHYIAMAVVSASNMLFSAFNLAVPFLFLIGACIALRAGPDKLLGRLAVLSAAILCVLMYVKVSQPVNPWYTEAFAVFACGYILKLGVNAVSGT
jgi:hypothetical protein